MSNGPDFAELILCKRCVEQGHLTTRMQVGIRPGGEHLRVWCARHKLIVQDYELLDAIDVREW